MRVLEDHLELAAKRPQPRLRQVSEFLAAVADASGAWPDESEQRPAEGRLAGTGLADDAEHLAPCEIEVDSVNGVHHAGRAAEKASRSVGP